MTTDFDHIVIGAGISGLGAAHFAARRGLTTLVLESADRIGGCLNSQTFDGLDGFWVEGGGHTCFNSYGNLLSILDDLELTGQALRKRSVGYHLWKDGRRRAIVSALHPWEALQALPRAFVATKTGRSVADYYGEILGARNYRDLLRYAFQAVICQPADDYPAEALFRRKPRRRGMLKAFTFAGGLSAIVQAIAAQPEIEVRTGQQVTAIVPGADGFRVELADETSVRATFLTLAVPPDAAAALLPDEFAAARTAIGDLGMSDIETLVLAFHRAELTLPPIAGLIAVEDAFYSAVSRDFLPDERYRGFAFHFRAGALSEEDQIVRACAALDADPVQIAGRARLRNRLPALRQGHTRRTVRLDAALANTRLAITGNWFLGVSIEDALTRSLKETDRLFAGIELSARDAAD